MVALCSSNRFIQMVIPKRLTKPWCLMACRQLHMAATALAQEWSGPPTHTLTMAWDCVFSALDTQVCWMIRRFGEMMAACRALLTSTPRMSPAWWHLPWSRTGISLGHWASMPCDHAVYNVYTVYTHVFSDVFSWLSNAFVSKLAVAGAHGRSDTDLDRAQGLVDERGNQTLRGAFLCGPCWICWKFPHAYHARCRSWYPKTSLSQWHVPGCLRSCLAEMRTWMWSPTNRCSSQWQLQALWTFTTQIPAKLTWKLTTWQLERETWTKHPLSVSTLLAVCVLEGLFDWTVDVAERLRFVEVHVFFSCGSGKMPNLLPFAFCPKVIALSFWWFGRVFLPQIPRKSVFINPCKVNQQGSPGSAMLMTEVLEGSRLFKLSEVNRTHLTYARRQDTYQALGMEPSGTRKLEEYIGEYYRTWRVKCNNTNW